MWSEIFAATTMNAFTFPSHQRPPLLCGHNYLTDRMALLEGGGGALLYTNLQLKQRVKVPTKNHDLGVVVGLRVCVLATISSSVFCFQRINCQNVQSVIPQRGVPGTSRNRNRCVIHIPIPCDLDFRSSDILSPFHKRHCGSAVEVQSGAHHPSRVLRGLHLAKRSWGI